jgi:hypothetical protein
MPFYQKGDVRIRYEETGSGFPLLVTPGGGLNSRVGNWPTAVLPRILKDPRHLTIHPNRTNQRRFIEAAHFCVRISIARATWWVRAGKVIRAQERTILGSDV